MTATATLDAPDEANRPLRRITGAEPENKQVLTFRLQGEEYGVDILRVQEIQSYAHITPLPNTPAYVKGAINLRGAVVPIIDLRAKFSLEQSACDQFSVIIVLNVSENVVGVVVDGVSDVITPGADDLSPPPQLGYEVESSFIEGVIKDQGRLITLLDVESLFPSIETQSTSKTSTD